MRVLLVSTYELGHQPVHIASPAAALRAAGHDVRAVDLSVERWTRDTITWAERIAFSVPMHTAMRLAIRAAGIVRGVSDAPICFYGLYAPVARDRVVGQVADRAIAGEYEAQLVEWVGNGGTGLSTDLTRQSFLVPARDILPPLERYAHLAFGGCERRVGAVEATHGCAHRCTHCPVPVVYDGRVRPVSGNVVLADIAQLVDLGAEHITFADPDFLNAVPHATRVVHDLHTAFPDLTFDITTKVEHILRHDALWPDLAARGCLFVVSAIESVNDDILRRLRKGHRAADAARAVHLLREHGIEMRPSFLPFTPWSSVEDVFALCEFVAAHDLVGNVDPVQYTIRLLVPDGSLLLGDIAVDGYDADLLTWTWTATDPRADVLQRELVSLVESGGGFDEIRALVARAAGVDPVPVGTPAGAERPRLTEPWFC